MADKKSMQTRRQKNKNDPLTKNIDIRLQQLQNDYLDHLKVVQDNVNIFAATLAKSKAVAKPTSEDTINVSENSSVTYPEDNSKSVVAQFAVPAAISKPESTIQQQAILRNEIADRVDAIRKSSRATKLRTRYSEEDYHLEPVVRIVRSKSVSPQSKKGSIGK